MREIEIPSRPTIRKLQAAAAGCQACDLWKSATQTVFGEGKQTSTVMLIGEQPGDKEDLAGAPFVGPAGALLDKALAEAGIDRTAVYVTNVVKHFKWEPRGKRRIHKKPNAAEITACRPWLQAEIAVVKPRAIVCLGSTAAQLDKLGQAVSGTAALGTTNDGSFLTTSAGDFGGVDNPAGAALNPVGGPHFNLALELIVDQATPTAKSTWSRVKQLYR